MTLLAAFSPLFTAPSFRTFYGLACGFLAQPGRRTVCGMLAGVLPGRAIRVTADSAYAGRELKGLPPP
jgi:hypothetical protein